MSLPEPRTPAGVRALQAIIASPGDTLVGLDFDGTLAPIVDDPEQAYADPAAVRALGRLAEQVGAVVVITGRPVQHRRTPRRVRRRRRARDDGGAGPVRGRAMERRRDCLLMPPGACGDRRGGRGAARAAGLARAGRGTGRAQGPGDRRAHPHPARPGRGFRRLERAGPGAGRAARADASSPARTCGRSAPPGWTRERRCAPSWPRWGRGR